MEDILGCGGVPERAEAIYQPRWNRHVTTGCGAFQLV
jgi:hypothetical protein